MRKHPNANPVAAEELLTLTSLDLDAVIAAGWADPASFAPQEYKRAVAFYATQRRRDTQLMAVRQQAAASIQEWTGRTPRDVGSFGLRLNLETSDLDLGIGFPTERREEIVQTLLAHAAFKGERRTRFTTTRLVFAFACEGVEVDLSVLTDEDFVVACRMLEQIDATMTEPERIAHCWVKHLLREQGRLDDYAAWKLVTYARFCPEFHWVPIREHAHPVS
jgi:hypothetical protein